MILCLTKIKQNNTSLSCDVVGAAGVCIHVQQFSCLYASASDTLFVDSSYHPADWFVFHFECGVVFSFGGAWLTCSSIVSNLN